MLLLGFLLLATRSSGYAVLPRQVVDDPEIHPSSQDVSDMCSTCPEMRTLVSILWSCFSTLVLATWVSVHPNVPPPRTSFVQMAIVRFGTMLATMLMPEFTLLWACMQRVEVGSIYSNPKFRVEGRSWTRTHAFYLLMGGFVLYQGEDRYGVLTSEKLEYLLEQGFIDLPHIEEEEIQDKSKGDWVAKTIAVIQMLWFTAQLIARRVKGWAVTELEIMTLATIVMTIGMYLFWWDKPLDVRCQTKVYFRAAVEELPEPPELLRAVPIQESAIEVSLFRRLFINPTCRIFTNSTAVSDDNPVVPKRSSDWLYRNLFQSRFSTKKLLIFLFFPLVVFWSILKLATPRDAKDTVGNLEKPGTAACSTASEMEDTEGEPAGERPPPSQDITSARRPNLRTWSDAVPMFNGATGPRSQVAGIVFGIALPIYGAFLFLARPAEIPTSVERILWKYAPIYLASFPTGAGCIMMIYVGIVFGIVKSDGWQIAMVALILPFWAISIIVYLLIRATLAFDSLALLRKLPDTAYRELSWSDVIPSL